MPQLLQSIQQNFRSDKTRLWLIVYSFIAIFAGLQCYLLGLKEVNGVIFTHYNNFDIFRYSFDHLVDGKDLYIHHPSDHYDLFKYSPAFALFFGMFKIFPVWLGLIFWNALNSVVLAVGILRLPKLNHAQKNGALLICLIETFTSTQSSQCNGLIAGLILLAFSAIEKRQIILASLFLSITVFIKLFGIVAFALFLLYPNKPKMIVSTICWFALFSLIPLLVVSPQQLEFLYSSWLHLLNNDHSLSYGFSMMGWLHYWFGLNINKLHLLLIGVVLFLLPFVRLKMYRHLHFRMLLLSMVMVWVILFNHMAESPTLVIAVVGISVWFYATPRSTLDKVLLGLTILLTSLSGTDIFPAAVRHDLIYPYVVKVFPIILVFIRLMIELFQTETTTSLQKTGVASH
jgi:hypothetical protein